MVGHYKGRSKIESDGVPKIDPVFVDQNDACYCNEKQYDARVSRDPLSLFLPTFVSMFAICHKWYCIRLLKIHTHRKMEFWFLDSSCLQTPSIIQS